MVKAPPSTESIPERTARGVRRKTSTSRVPIKVETRTKGSGLKGRSDSPSKKDKDKIVGSVFSDNIVVGALSEIFHIPEPDMFLLMARMLKPILKAPLPGHGGRVPSAAMLKAAKNEVIKFYEKEEALGDRSDVAKAFYLASGECQLHFDWAGAKGRVRRTKLDRQQKIDKWETTFAMTSGDSQATSEIYVCGTRKLTVRALTSLICHEGLHNLAKRMRRGNPFLSEDCEHEAMALIGDPQLYE